MTGDYYTLKGKLKYLNGTFLILAIFALDCLTGSVTALMGQAETTDEWLKQIMVFQGARSVFAWMPYILILLLLRYRFMLDRTDEALIVLCLIMSIFETSDYITNYNWRGMWMDYIVFSIIAIPLISYKLHTVAKRLK